MNDWEFRRYIHIGAPTYINDKSGQILLPQQPKYKLVFQNRETEQKVTVTDLELKKQRREKKFKLLRETYKRYIFKKKLSVLLLVVNKERYHHVSEIISYFKKKLRRNNIELMAYVWIQDIGENLFEVHYHCMFIIQRIDGGMLCNLKAKDTINAGYKITFANSLPAFTNYLKKKEMYAYAGKRSYGFSRTFKLPVTVANTGVGNSNFLNGGVKNNAH